MSYLNSIEVKNFKRVKHAKITLPTRGGLIEICGLNFQGKSSIIDAIWAALGGANASPAEPIRRGQRKASVEITTDDLTITRVWSVGRNGNVTSKLIVQDRAGNEQRSPQSLVDALISHVAFDYAEFAGLDRARQAKILRELSGLDFTDLDSQRDTLYTERTEVNRAIKLQETKLADLPDVPRTDPVSLTTLQKDLSAANEFNLKQQSLKQTGNNLAVQMGQATSTIERFQAQIQELQEKIDRERAHLENLQGQWQATVDQVQEPRNTAPLMTAIENAEAINHRARQYQERHALETELNGNREHAERLTDQLEEIEAERRFRIDKADFPVAGLGFDDTGVTFNDIPFDQVSASERVRTSLAIGAARNPKLRSTTSRNGSLLDTHSLETVAQWAAENNYQVLLERVAEHPENQGVVIEDGLVVESTLEENSEDSANSANSPDFANFSKSGNSDNSADLAQEPKDASHGEGEGPSPAEWDQI